VPVGAEPEDRGWALELPGQIGERRDSDPPADKERSLLIEAVAVAQRAEDVELVARFNRAESLGSRADRFEQEAQLAGRRLAEAHRARKQSSGRLEHEELAGNAGIESTALDPDQRVGADGFVGDDSKRFSSAH
jgi:hypothetical protein